MKSELNKNLTNIRNFFALIRKENPTREEVLNFLLECKTFVFNQYGINESDYDITIHFTHPNILDFDEAKMCADSKYENKFEITLSFHKLSSKYNFLENKNESLNKAEILNKRNTSIFVLTQSFLHELGHCFQYIRNPKMMEKEDELKDSLMETFEKVCCHMQNNRKTRLIIKTLGKHINALAYMSRPEKDADKKGYIYFASILTKLISVEKDEEMIDYLCSIFN